MNGDTRNLAAARHVNEERSGDGAHRAAAIDLHREPVAHYGSQPVATADPGGCRIAGVDLSFLHREPAKADELIGEWAQ